MKTTDKETKETILEHLNFIKKTYESLIEAVKNLEKEFPETICEEGNLSSTNNMPFNLVLNNLKKGINLRRSNWPHRIYISKIDNNKCIRLSTGGNWTPTLEDLLASNWEVYRGLEKSKREIYTKKDMINFLKWYLNIEKAEKIYFDEQNQRVVTDFYEIMVDKFNEKLQES